MGLFGITTAFNKVIGVAFATDEIITKDSLTLDNDIVLTKPCLLKVKAATTTGNIKVTMAAGTDVTYSYADVNEANLHVTKIFKEGTTCLIGDFYLYR